MYLFYNETHAFSVDSYGYLAIIHALGCEFSKTNYTEKEILSLKQTIKPRKLTHALTTHSHYDHAGGNRELLKLSPETIIVDYQNLDETSKIEIYNVKPIPTPCHTMCSVSYLVEKKYLLTGDFLFKLGCGKFFEGNGRDFLNSCKNIYEACDESVILLYGHDYYDSNYSFAKPFINIDTSNNYFLTLKEEKQNNPFLNYKEAIQKLIAENKIKEEDFNKEEYQMVEYLRTLKDNFKTNN